MNRWQGGLRRGRRFRDIYRSYRIIAGSFLLESIQGSVIHIRYRNPENEYTVMLLEDEEGNEFTAVGVLPGVEEGDSLELEGEFVNHPSYGRQLKVLNCAIHEIQGAEAMQKYLSSGAVKGIGPSLAERIVEKFGEDSFRVIEEDPKALSSIRGISLKKAESVSRCFSEQAGMRQAMMFLQQFRLSNVLAVRIYEKYKNSLYGVISKDPYSMCGQVEGMSFRMADEIAGYSGVERHSPFRIRAGIIHVLEEQAQQGSVYVYEDVLVEEVRELLSIEEEEVRSEIEPMAVDSRIVVRSDGKSRQPQKYTEPEEYAQPEEFVEPEESAQPQKHTESEKSAKPGGPADLSESGRCAESLDRAERFRVYLPYLYRMEAKCARMLLDLDMSVQKAGEGFEEDIRRIARESGILLGGHQEEAVRGAVENGVFIMTGGPGTGKTTTVRILLKYFLSRGMDVTLTAPTGRAAKRLSETTGMEARTIHRCLEISSGEIGTDGPESYNIKGFARNEDNPLETDVVIVDEMSMVDISLFHALLSAIEAGTRLIMVGDEHQLPSVGPGAVLKDLTGSGHFKVVSLNKVFRQAEESDIIMNAHAILEDRPMKLNNKSRDFFFLNRDVAGQILEGVIYLVSKKLPPYVKVSPFEIQVLTPMKKGILGVESLNTSLQAALNPPSPDKEEYKYKNGVLRTGDKVMQIKNNYQLEWELAIPGSSLRKKGAGVFNGDMGVVEDIDSQAGQVTVIFDDDRRVKYTRDNSGELELSYAITIHKSQGSEYPAVVIPLLGGPRQLMTRNLLYTALTRARECVTIIGSRQTMDMMRENIHEQTRNTSLAERIAEVEMMERAQAENQEQTQRADEGRRPGTGRRTDEGR